MANDQYVKVANKKDLNEGGLLKAQHAGKQIVLSMVNGKIYAMDAVCSHEGGPLEDGTLEGYEVECPWHGSKFDVRTGEVTNPPADTPQSIYEVRVEDNDILLSNTSAVREQHDVISEVSREKKTSFYELTLLEKKKIEGTDIISFKYSKKDEQQQVEVNSKDSKTLLDYIAGQYAYFDIGGVNNDPKGPIRHFTLASSPTEDFIMISTRIRDTPYKKRLSSLEKGVKVKVRGPEGKFVLHEDHSKPAIFLSGGIGVTPFRSMIKYSTDKQSPIKIIMFDSNRNEQNILYKNEFDAWVNANKNLNIIYTITEEERSSSPANEWRGEHGRIDKAMLTRYLSREDLGNSIYYTCGPPAMIKAMQTLLQGDLQIPKERIKVEEFTGY